MNPQMLAAMAGGEDEVRVQIGRRALNSSATTKFEVVEGEKQKVQDNAVILSDTQLDGQYVLLVANEEMA